MPATPPTTASAIIVAAGRGTRYGAVDKVLLPLGGRPLLAWSLDAFALAEVGQVVVVAGLHTIDPITELLASSSLGDRSTVVVGGSRRQDSVAAGVRALPVTTGPILIHDGARPLVTPRLIDHAIQSIPAGGAAVVAAPVTDTLKRVSDDLVVRETVSRVDLWAAQTPQVFTGDALRAAIADPAFAQYDYTDEAGLFEALGLPVVIVPNPDPNPKLTHPGDLAVIEALITPANNEEAR